MRATPQQPGSDEMSALHGLRLPEMRPATNPADYKPRAFDSWLNGLPTANAERCGGLMLQRLREINSTQLEPALRQRLLMQIAHLLERVTPVLARGLLDSTLPLSSKLKTQSDLCRQLHAQMATGWRIAVRERGSADNTKATEQVTPLYCALLHAGRAMYFSWLSYAAPSHQDWQALHGLYRYALASGIPNQGPDGVPGMPVEENIGQAYLRTLLLYIAQPFSLRPREIEATKKLLRQLGDHADISPLPGTRRDGGFVVDLSQGRPPYAGKPATDTQTDSVHILHCAELAEVIRTRLTDTELTGLSGPARQALSRHLYRAWGARRQRQFTRNTDDGRVHLQLGLVQTHRLASNWDSAADDWMEHVRDELDWLEHNLWNMPDPDEQLGVASNIRPSSPRPRPAAALQQDTQELQPLNFGEEADESFADEPDPVVYCTLIDQSAGGFGLFWEPSNPAKARVGELFALQDGANGVPIGIGVIRWLMAFGGGQFKLGVEMLSPRAHAASIYRDQMRQARPALLLPEVAIQHTPASLIVPALTFQVGDHANVLHENGGARVRLTRLIESTASYSRYQYLEVGDVVQPQEPAVESSAPDGKQDDWALL